MKEEAKTTTSFLQQVLRKAHKKETGQNSDSAKKVKFHSNENPNHLAHEIILKRINELDAELKKFPDENIKKELDVIEENLSQILSLNPDELEAEQSKIKAFFEKADAAIEEVKKNKTRIEIPVIKTFPKGNGLQRSNASNNIPQEISRWNLALRS